jgi:hypothetical protein
VPPVDKPPNQPGVASAKPRLLKDVEFDDKSIDAEDTEDDAA